MDQENNHLSKSRRQLLAEAFLYAAIFGLAIVTVPYFIVKGLHYSFMSEKEFKTYSWTFLALLPFMQGMIAGIKTVKPKVGIGKSFLLLIGIILFDLGLAAVFFSEGIICLIMAIPLYLSIIGLGLSLGRALGRIKGRKAVFLTILPLSIFLSSYDAAYTKPNYNAAISDAVTINARPQIVWNYIISYPENKSPAEYWMWKLGLPMPIQSTASGKTIGSERNCKFTTGIGFEEKITEVVPNKSMTFIITKQPDHPEIIGHFSLDKGQFYLEDNKDGTTTIVATSWYHLYVQPAVYFSWWTDDIIRNVHFRVLNHIKRLAENQV